MRIIHWLFESRKKQYKGFCVTCKFYHECNPEPYEKKSKKLDKIDQKIIRTTKKLDRHIEEYKRIAQTMR